MAPGTVILFQGVMMPALYRMILGDRLPWGQDPQGR